MVEKYNNIVIEWKEYIFQNIRRVETQAALFEYVNILINNSTPVIIDFNHLALLLGIQNGILAKIVANSSSFYYTFNIPKRSGGERSISAPYPILLSAQRWIYHNILSNIKIHNAAKGFVNNVSIADNARVHMESDCVLKMDIKDFFPSIKFNRVMSIFRHLGYTTKISYYLASICCLDGALPQGAPTSPIISNIILKRLDARVSGLAAKFNLKYTRYADDFTLSGADISKVIISYINTIVCSEGFTVNNSKTKLIRGRKQKIITGVSISSGELKIPKNKKREVRKNVFYILRNGYHEHLRNIGSRDPIYVERLLGYLYFWKSIEPNNEYVKESINKIKQYSRKLDTMHNND